MLLTADCGGFTAADLDESPGTELAVLRSHNEMQGYVDLHCLNANGEMSVSSARLSRGFDSAERMLVGRLSDEYFMLDPRTLEEEEFAEIAAMVRRALKA